MNKQEKLSTEPYRGVRDFYPEEQAFLNYLFMICRRVSERMGYVEYHASILEPAELYRAKGADNAEMAQEQTYTFIDRGGREVTLRPEMTPTVARMVAARRRELGYPLRLFSLPNVFRYERPQRGRLREHWQLNVDLFGSASLAADAEIIATAAHLMEGFGASTQDFTIRVSSRVFLNTLITDAGLDEEGGKRLAILLDRRAKMTVDEFTTELASLKITPEQLSPSSIPEDVDVVLKLLTGMGIENAVFDPSIVRGFAYYTGIVFEVFDTHPDNNRSLFGGGRYENLTKLFDDEPVTGVGFGMGDVTIRDFMSVHNLIPTFTPPTHVYLAITTKDVLPAVLAFADELRSGGINVAVDFGDRKLSDQIKTASKHKIPRVIVVGPDELASGQFTARNIETGQEQLFSRSRLGDVIF